MLNVFLGTDSKRARLALNTAAAKTKAPVVRITDVSSLADLHAALGGGGMFAQKRTVVLDNVSANAEAWAMFAAYLLDHKKDDPLTVSDTVLVLEEKVDAATKKLLQKVADTVEVFDAPKAARERPTVFALVNHLQAGDKKKLWVAYQQELASGNAPEAIHGVLFWGVKQALLAAKNDQDVQRSRQFIAELAELPHESRRRGEELEYALERFILSVV